MSAFSKVSVGRNTQKYSHNMSYDLNTTLPFGVVQPTYYQHMYADSDINVQSRQLLRLAPLHSPTFGRIHLQNEVRFVPTVDVCPFFDCIMSKMTYSNGQNTSYIPTQVPVISNSILMLALLAGYTEMQVVGVGSDNVISEYRTSNKTKVDWFDAGIFDSFPVNVNEVSDYDLLNFNQTTLTGDDSITFENADFIVRFDYSGSADSYTYALFRLTPAGRRIRTILVGLGYSLNMQDSDPVSLLPLLAWYKGYFDLYAPKKDLQWLDTNCFKVIQAFADNYTTTNINLLTSENAFSDTSANTFNRIISRAFWAFFADLADCFYSEPLNFVSANTDSPNPYLGLLESSGSTGSQTLNGVTVQGSSATGMTVLSTVNQFGLEFLKRVSRLISKDSVIGGKMSDWLRVHFGSDVANSVFKESNNVASWRLDAEINDVFSTSDTAIGDGDTATGEYLGSYAGKGLGFTKEGFKFHCPVDGYIFMYSSIVPEAGYFQGNDTDLYAIDYSTLPMSDYDAVGYELTPLSVVYGDNGLLLGSSSTFDGKSFGYIPRYSGLKYHKNVVNGDMSRRGSIDSYYQYYLDRIINNNVIVYDAAEKTVVEKSITSPSLASQNWRYPCRYNWIGNFNRIFYNEGSDYKGSSLPGTFTQQEYSGTSVDDIDDNFMLQCVFKVTVKNFLKPVSMSYDTYDEEHDNSSVDVRQF